MSTILTSALSTATINWGNQKYFEASKTAFSLPFLECIAGIGYLAQTTFYLPLSIIKLPISFVYCLRSSSNDTIKIIHEKTLPGITDVIFIAMKACICFINIFVAPLLALINADENYKYHLKCGLINAQETGALLKKTENKVKLEDIILDPKVKDQIMKEIIYPVKFPDIFKVYNDKKSSPTTGVILFGSPGCGKTLLARCIAGELDKQFIEVNVINCGSKYLHETGHKINEFFQKAIQKKAVLFLDEADSLLGSRRTTDILPQDRGRNDEVNALLQLIPQAIEAGVIIIAATNHIKTLDAAAKRDGRFGVHIKLKSPSKEGLESLFQQALRNRHPADDINYSDLAEMSEGFTGATVHEVVRLAINQTISDLCKNNLGDNSINPPPISQETLADIIIQKQQERSNSSLG